MLNKSVRNFYISIVCVLGLKNIYSHQYLLIVQFENGIIFHHEALNHKFRYNDVLNIFNQDILKHLVKNNPNIILNFIFIKSTPFTSDKFKNLFLNTDLNFQLIARKDFPKNLLNVHKEIKLNLKIVNNILYDRYYNGYNEYNKFKEIELVQNNSSIERVNKKFYIELIEKINNIIILNTNHL